MVINTCALYGATNYANSWIGINLLVVLMSFAIVAFIYSIGRFLPERMRGKITEATKFEITQLLLSIVIISILIGSAQIACNTSASFGKNILVSAGVPASKASLSPFQYADYYIGRLSMQTGLNLLTQIFAANIGYSIEGAIYGSVGTLLTPVASPNLVAFFTKQAGSTLSQIVSVQVSEKMDFGNVLRVIADTYLGFLATTTTVIVGALFLQYILLPILQFSAFTVLLPVALAMRSLSFTGRALRDTSNAVLAVAIAAYIIYPLMVLFDSYAMYWVFSAANPTSVYLNVAYTTETLPLNTFFASSPSTAIGSVQSSVSLISTALSSVGGLKTMLDPWAVVVNTELIINALAELAFQGVVLFAINAAVTIGFAIGLAKALNAGIEGAGSFWSNL